LAKVEAEIVRLTAVGDPAASDQRKMRKVVELLSWPQYMVSMLLVPSAGTQTRWPNVLKGWVNVVKDVVTQSTIWSMLNR
jgi:hypothetical protein